METSLSSRCRTARFTKSTEADNRNPPQRTAAGIFLIAATRFLDCAPSSRYERTSVSLLNRTFEGARDAEPEIPNTHLDFVLRLSSVGNGRATTACQTFSNIYEGCCAHLPGKM